MTYQSQKKYIGHISQLFNVKEYEYTSGRARGSRAVDVSNGAGLSFTVGVDRCMDFTSMNYKGVNLSYLAPAGIVAPEYYSDKELDFLRSFAAGLLTTCGIESSGSPSRSDGEAYPLHGRIGNAPAENVCVDVDDSGEPTVTLKGRMREARLFGQNLRLTRTIRCTYGENAVRFTDEIENIGTRDSSMMMLYHFNMGYPLLSEHSRFVLPTLRCDPRDAHAAEGIESWNVIEPPIHGFAEMCYFLTLARDEHGRSFACIYNDELELGLVLRFDAALLDHFTMWKQIGETEYVVGLEPCMQYPDGREAAIADGSIKYIAPGEKKPLDFSIEIVDGREALERISAEAAALTANAE